MAKPDILARIRDWREDDSQGYFEVIELICDAEDEIVRLREMVTPGSTLAGESRQEEVTEVNITTPACGKLE